MGAGLETHKGTFAMASGLLLGLLFMAGKNLAAAASQPTQTNAGGSVTVSVTYLNPEGAEDARFQVALNTHSIDLDGYDLKTLALLRDNTGKSYQPAQVENEGGGHHRRILMIFPKPSPKAKKLELVIKDLAGVKERVFHWDLSR